MAKKRLANSIISDINCGIADEGCYAFFLENDPLEFSVEGSSLGDAWEAFVESWNKLAIEAESHSVELEN